MSRSRAEWEETSLKPFIKRFPERQARFTTPSGLELHPLYAPEDAKPGIAAAISYSKKAYIICKESLISRGIPAPENPFNGD